MSSQTSPPALSVDLQWLLARVEASLFELERINPHARKAFAELTLAAHAHPRLLQSLHTVKDDLHVWLHAGKHLPADVFLGMETRWDALAAVLRHTTQPAPSPFSPSSGSQPSPPPHSRRARPTRHKS